VSSSHSQDPVPIHYANAQLRLSVPQGGAPQLTNKKGAQPLADTSGHSSAMGGQSGVNFINEAASLAEQTRKFIMSSKTALRHEE